MTKKEKIKAILRDKRLRIPFFGRDKNLLLFAKYYFNHLFRGKSAPFHYEWAEAYGGNDNVLCKGFRGSAKTTLLLAKYAREIAYRKRRFITHYCSEGSKSEAFLFDLVVQLQSNRRFIDDFGELYPKAGAVGGKKQKAGISEFITRNEVRVKAMSIGQSPRGLVYSASDGSFRPDLAGLDDIDTLRTVSNSKMVDKTFAFVNNEIIGGLQNEAQIIFLGNVIKFDGVVPRFEQAHADNPDWVIFSQPAVNPD